ARCEGLTFVDGNVRSVTLRSDGNSDWTYFEIKGDRLGEFYVELTAYHGGSFLGRLKMELGVGGPSRDSRPADGKKDMFLRPRGENEITLRIDTVRTYGELGYHRFTLVDGTIAAPRVFKGEEWKQLPGKAVEALVEQLNKAASKSTVGELETR